jgi:hypothetical protein
VINKLDKLNISSYVGKTKKYRVSKKRKELYKYTFTLNDYYYTLDESIRSTLSRPAYINIMKDYFEDFVNRVIINRERLHISKTLGVHRIKKSKTPGMRPPKIDYNKTKQHNTLIFHNNSHSNGYYFQWFWDKRTIKKLAHSQIYTFDLQPKQAKKIGKEVFRCNKDPYIKDYDALS